MRGPLAPLEREPVSVHAPFISYPSGHYHPAGTQERHSALIKALQGVQLGAYDQRIVQWLASQDVPLVATVISLLYRIRKAATPKAPRYRRGGEPR